MLLFLSQFLRAGGGKGTAWQGSPTLQPGGGGDGDGMARTSGDPASSSCRPSRLAAAGQLFGAALAAWSLFLRITHRQPEGVR